MATILQRIEKLESKKADTEGYPNEIIHSIIHPIDGLIGAYRSNRPDWVDVPIVGDELEEMKQEFETNHGHKLTHRKHVENLQ